MVLLKPVYRLKPRLDLNSVFFFQSLPLTYEQHSRRFSAQMHRQPHRNLRSGQVMCGAANMSQDIMYEFCCRDYVFFTSTPVSVLITKSSFDIFVTVFCTFDPSWDICILLVFFLFCVCRMLETSSTCPLACDELCVGFPAFFSHWLILTIS